MSRWPSGARERLERAALELFVEQGFADTTVPQITARAGLTTRTFFRHFADKREVLFAYQAELPAVVARVLADAQPSSNPIGVIAEALPMAASRIEDNLDYLRTRRAVVAADEGLVERELRKQSILSDAMRLGLLDRGFDELTSTLAAHTAVTVFTVALNRWLDQEGERPLSAFIHDTLTALTSLVSKPAAKGHESWSSGEPADVGTSN